MANTNTITIYITHLNRENRMINADHLSSYLATCNSVSIDTTYPIIPNVPFYCDISALAIEEIVYDYNYLSYTYNNATYYSFIDSIDFMASEGICRINHTTDYWIMSQASKSLLISHYYLNGTVTRALLEDYEDYDGATYTPNLYETLNVPEVQYNNASLGYAKYKPLFPNFAENYDQLWLYIYVANSNTMTDEWKGSQSSLNNVPSLGLTMVYPLIKYATSNTIYYFICYLDTDGNADHIYFSSANITNSDITSMLISPIPPMPYQRSNGGYNYTAKTLTIFSTDYTVYFTNYLTTILAPLSSVEGMVPYLNIPQFLGGIECTTETLYDGLNGNSFVNNEGVYLRWRTSQNVTGYLTDNPKALSNVYNPVYIEDIPLSYMQMPETGDSVFYTIYLSADLTCYGYVINASTYTGDYCKMHKKQITSAFSPTVLKDYWTRLNASIESISAQGTQTKSVINGISSVLSIASSLASTALAVTGDMSNLGMAKLALKGQTSAINSVGSLVDSVYNFQVADKQQEIADYQYNTGSTNETAAMYLSGVFDFSDLPTVYTVRQPDINLQQISYQLATKGENCHLDFISYWNNHTQREYFEYIQMTDVTVYESNAEIALNLQQMFAKGVRLWYMRSTTASVGNPYEVENYPHI